jgi:hypothetical protein
MFYSDIQPYCRGSAGSTDIDRKYFEAHRRGGGPVALGVEHRPNDSGPITNVVAVLNEI